MGPFPIETDRLLLREFRLEDILQSMPMLLIEK
jgi:hypothetical protein